MLKTGEPVTGYMQNKRGNRTDNIYNNILDYIINFEEGCINKVCILGTSGSWGEGEQYFETFDKKINN